MNNDDTRSSSKALGATRRLSDVPMSKLTYAERCEKIRAFLHDYHLVMPEEFIEVLAFCNTRAEVWFVREIVTSTGWKRIDQRTLSNGLYNLTVQADLGDGVLADILFEDILRGITAAFLMDYPRSLPSQVRARNAKVARIRPKVGRVIPIRSDRAKSLGKSFRVDLMRDRFRNAAEYERHRNPPTKARFWTGADLAYDVSDLEASEREEYLRQWLVTQSPVPDEWIPILARCNRAADVHFALQLLSLPRISLENGGFCFHDMYQMYVRPQVEGQQVEFLIEPVGAGATRSRSVIRITPPRHQSIDLRRAAAADEALLNAGYQVFRAEAGKAKFLGFRWKEYIIADVRNFVENSLG